MFLSGNISEKLALIMFTKFPNTFIKCTTIPPRMNVCSAIKACGPCYTRTTCFHLFHMSTFLIPKPTITTKTNY